MAWRRRFRDGAKTGQPSQSGHLATYPGDDAVTGKSQCPPGRVDGIQARHVIAPARGPLQGVIQPAAKSLGPGLVNWQVLRRSYATWMIAIGGDAKSTQAQMRHATLEPTLAIYAQVVSEAQRSSIGKLWSTLTAARTMAWTAKAFQLNLNWNVLERERDFEGM